MDLATRTLSRRETAMRRFEAPPAAIRDMDAAEFQKQYTAFDRHDPPDPEMLLLLSLVKINSAEAYGVNCTFQASVERALRNDDDLELRILCEETYHTRLLLSSARHYGLVIDQPYHPPAALRMLIGGISGAPEFIARPLTLAGELLGTVLFVKLFEIAGRVLAHDPETRDAVLQRILEICIDERGHISYNRLNMSAAELLQTRLILPMVGRVMSSVLPEVCALGAYPKNIGEDLQLLVRPRCLPEEVSRDWFVA